MSGHKKNKRKENPEVFLSLTDWSEVTGLSETELQGDNLPLNALVSPRYPLLSNQNAALNQKGMPASAATISAMNLFTSHENRQSKSDPKQHVFSQIELPIFAICPTVDPSSSLSRKEVPPVIWAKDVTFEVFNEARSCQSLFKRRKSLPKNNKNKVAEHDFKTDKPQDPSSNRLGF